MRGVFGSEFYPSDQDYLDAGYTISGDDIQFPEGDWGMDEPKREIQSIEQSGDHEYEAEVLYTMIDSDDELIDWCIVTWYFRRDDQLGKYVICDASMEMIFVPDDSYYGQWGPFYGEN